LMASKNLEFSLKDISSSIESPFLRLLFLICWPFRKFIKFK